MGTEASDLEANLLGLPTLIVSSHVFDKLAISDRKCLRTVCKSIRQIVNGEVQVARLSGCHISAGRQPFTLERLVAEFPQVNVLALLDTLRSRITGPLLSDFLVSSSPGAPGARLRELDLKQCHFLTSIDLQRLVEACPQLQKLATSRWVDGAQLRALQQLGSHITELDLGDNATNITSITNKSLTHMPPLPKLQSISLRRCVSVTDEGIAHLGTSRLPSLTHLDLSSTRVAGVSGFSGLKLKALELRNCRSFTDAGLAAVCATHAETLQSLEVHDTAVQPSNACLWHLAQVSGLERLDLGPSWEVDLEGLAALACCRTLSELCVGNFNLRQPPAPPVQAADGADGPLVLPGAGPGAAAAGAGGAGLEVVWTADMAGEETAGGGDGAAGGAPGAPAPLASLTHLSLGGMFCQQGLAGLLPRLGRLRTLELVGLNTVRDEVLAQLGGRLAAVLEDLLLSGGGPELSAKGLAALPIRLPKLRRLTLVNCPSATGSTVRQLSNVVQSPDRQPLQVKVYGQSVGRSRPVTCAEGAYPAAAAAEWAREKVMAEAQG